MPKKIALWIAFNHASAWSGIGSEMNIKSSVEDKELVSTVKALKKVCNIGLRSQDIIAKNAVDMQINLKQISGMPKLAKEIKTTAEHAKNLAYVGEVIADIKGDFRSQVQEGLVKIDKANRQIEKFAETSVYREVYQDWSSALQTLRRARRTITEPVTFSRDYQNDLAEALKASDLKKINEIISKIEPNVDKARTQLRNAEYVDSQPLGKLGRALGRMLHKGSQSRIGKELAVTFKSLVLGTKMFYDLMDIDSNTDIISWSSQYQNDMNQIMDEMEEIQRMDGWSLTGKNTFIEDAVNKSHSKMFKK